MPKVRIKATTSLKRKPVKAQSRNNQSGGIFTAKVVAIVRKQRNKDNGKVPSKSNNNSR